MITVLEEIGVKPMDAVGKEFNPDFHNAVMHEENEEMGEEPCIQRVPERIYVQRWSSSSQHGKSS